MTWTLPDLHDTDRGSSSYQTNLRAQVLEANYGLDYEINNGARVMIRPYNIA